MNRKPLLRVMAGVFFLLLFTAGGRFLYLEIGRTFSDDPTVWEPEVSAFEKMDMTFPPPAGGVLFVGSSSIRFWEDLAEDMAPLRVIRRGFGGARLSDLIHFADRVIFPYSPRAIVIHAGGNELKEVPGNRSRTPEEAHADFRSLIELIRTRFATVPVYYLALRPAKRPGPRGRFLELVRGECEAQPGLDYLDAGAGISLADGSPDPSLIRWDRIHLNRAGYEAWAPGVYERLMRDLGTVDEVPPHQ